MQASSRLQGETLVIGRKTVNLGRVSSRGAFLDRVNTLFPVNQEFKVVDRFVQASTRLQRELLVISGLGKNMDFRGTSSGSFLLDRANVPAGQEQKVETAIRLVQASARVQGKFPVTRSGGNNMDFRGIGSGIALLDSDQVILGRQEKREIVARLVQASARVKGESLIIGSGRKDMNLCRTRVGLAFLDSVNITIGSQ